MRYFARVAYATVKQDRRLAFEEQDRRLAFNPARLVRPHRRSA
jgi:hypothetical protein